MSAAGWLLGLIAAACACGTGPLVNYRLRGVATGPFGRQGTDGSVEFAATFCSTLTHIDESMQPPWGDCAQYLEGQPAQQPKPTMEISRDWRVLVVGGIFSHCFEQRQIYAFQPALEHLQTVHHLETRLLSVGSVDSPEDNAKTIAEYLGKNPGKYIAVGHSKGAVDLMTAIQNHQEAKDNIRALVSVAGAISGSRLIDNGIDATILGFQKAVRDSGLGKCEIKENGGVASMRRESRNAFLRTWSPPQGLHSYSIVGIVDEQHTSTPLLLGWRRQHLYSIDQDSQMIAEEAIIPGARFLGVARGDHWAMALPFFEHANAEYRKKVNWNRFPRTALLEAIVRYVDSGT